MCLSLRGPFLLGVVVLEPSLAVQRVYNICVWLAANGSALFLGTPERWQCVAWTLSKLSGSRVFIYGPTSGSGVSYVQLMLPEPVSFLRFFC